MNYHIARDGQQLGSFSESEISAKLQAGELSGGDLCWGEGMAEWQPISQVLQVSASAEAINPYAAPRADVSRPAAAGVTSGELASLGQRLGAVVLDGVVAVPLAIPLGIGAAMADPETGKPNSMGLMLMGVGGLLILALVIYNLYRLSTQGQTIGKQLMKIRIVRFEDNGTAGFVKAVLLRGFVNGLIGAIPLLGFIYSLVDICFIFREDRRCIHDMIGGTHVIQA